MPSHLSETAFNVELASEMRDRNPRWRGDAIVAEATGVLRGAAALRPDILVTDPVGYPVAIETEYEPARSVESDALSRLGRILEATGRSIDAAIAVRVPAELSTVAAGRLSESIASSELRYCLYSFAAAPAAADEQDQNAAGPARAEEGFVSARAGERGEGAAASPSASGLVRFPEKGWVTGGIDDLAGLVERVMLPEAAIALGTLALERGVTDAAAILGALEESRPEVLRRVAQSLHQDEGEQTRRMAMAICANALVFQSAVSGSHESILDPADPRLRTGSGRLSKRRVLAAWQEILKVNYWPIFAVATDVLASLPENTASDALERLAVAAEELAALGAVTTGDLAGQMFGRLIADRKFLATFYTLPSSAALLAELAMSRVDCDFASPADVAALRIADLACGTGALLSAAYRSLAGRYRRAGGDDEAMHPAMMEHSLIAADIMPAATHLSASVLSGMYPSTPFGRTRVYTMPYGLQSPERPVAIGSLELLGNDRVMSLFGTGRLVASGAGSRCADAETEADVADASLDLVIMNPPFTRSTNHEGAAAGVPRPAFAGFDTSDAEQRQMAARLDDIYRGLAARAGHGNAGLASNFIDLAHAKAKPGGVLALVLPAAAAGGGAWQPARDLLRGCYAGAVVVTIASAGATDRAFSADTAMAEALIVATKRAGSPPRPDDDAVLWVSLKSRPRGAVEAAETARAVVAADRSGHSAGRLRVGEEAIGCFVRGGWDDGGCAGVANPDVIEAAAVLQEGVLRLTGCDDARLPLVPLRDLGDRGLYHLDIAGPALSARGAPRGPFDIEPLPWNDSPPSYPVLWRHDASRERRLVVEPDSQGTVREGRRAHALEVWATATRLHLNLDFRLNSQSLACCLTPGAAIGGRAWPNYRLQGSGADDLEDREKLVALWMNTTLGLIGFWWLGTRQQQGRAVLTITRLGDLVSIDPRRLSPEQTRVAAAAFDELSAAELLPAHRAVEDPVRHRLDEVVLADVLNLPAETLDRLAVLREQWCAEPSVHGGRRA